jgi:hypothetical protein
MSYARFDDQRDGSQLTQFRERLSNEIQAKISQFLRIAAGRRLIRLDV